MYQKQCLQAKQSNDMTNYRFLKTETNSKALYIFHCFFTTSSVKLFVVAIQIFVYKFFQKKEKKDKTFQILKMKTPFEKEPHL
jgi:hypothetical protein